MEEKLSCIDCHLFGCRKGTGEYPEFCLTKNLSPETYERAMNAYEEEENHRVMVSAALTEHEGYKKRTRVEEVMHFAHKIGAKKLGIATCIGLIEESRTLAKILRLNGFEVVGVACKVSATKKVDIGIPAQCEATGPIMCNPILQAELLNDAETDLNLIMGLCVGHDSLFIKHSNALVTSVVTKDRVLGHNPVACIYQAEGYYKKLMIPQEF